jgi:hypothetical protein
MHARHIKPSHLTLLRQPQAALKIASLWLQAPPELHAKLFQQAQQYAAKPGIYDQLKSGKVDMNSMFGSILSKK